MANKSGFPGVSYKASHKQWRARVRRGGRSYIKYAKTAEEAAVMYEKLCAEHQRVPRKTKLYAKVTEEEKAARAAKYAKKHAVYYKENKEHINKKRAAAKKEKREADPQWKRKNYIRTVLQELRAVYKELSTALIKERILQRTRKKEEDKKEKEARYTKQCIDRAKKKADLARIQRAKKEAWDAGAEERKKRRLARDVAKQARRARVAKKAADKAYAALRLEAGRLKKETGVLCHVDHCVPLNGMIQGVRLVCGLHVAYNFQLLTAEENNIKSCTSWPDQPEYTADDIEELRKVGYHCE